MDLSEFAKTVLKEVSDLTIQKPIETDRVFLRPFREGDLNDLFEFLSQKEQQRLSGNIPVESVEDAREILMWIMDTSHPVTCFAVALKQSGKVIGNFSIGRYPFLEMDETLRQKRGVSLSCVLNENWWRQGIMSAVFRAAFARFFLDADLEFVNAGYFDFNEASGGMQKKLGMRHWMDHVYEHDGRRIPTKEMIMWREDYLQSNSAIK